MTRHARSRRRLRDALVTCMLVGTISGTAAVNARADSQIASFSATTSTQAAGAHPDLNIDLGVATTDYPPTVGDGGIPHPAPDEYLQSVSVHLPPGLLANAAAAPTCSETVLETENASACPAGSMVGLFNLSFASQFSTDPTTGLPVAEGQFQTQPIINEPPLPSEAARFAIPIGSLGVVIHVDVTVADASDYGAVATVSGISSAFPIDSVGLTFWGVPSAPANDLTRLSCYDGNEFACSSPVSLPGSTTFLVNPTSCTGQPLPVTAAATFYGDPTTYTATSDLPPTTGCASLPFSPSLSFSGATGTVGQPDAFTANLTVPQDDPGDTSGATTSAVQGVSVNLPAGVALSPGVAGGLSACSDAEFALGTHSVPGCPLSSQIGTVTVNTPLLSAPLTGEVFVGQQESDDPTSGNMYRLFLGAEGSGVDLKLVGNVTANPSTGQLSVSFPNDPQVPFSSLQLALKGGPRAPLANPPTCGTATSSWSMTPFSSPTTPVTGTSSYAVTGNCALSSQFTPSLTAGTVSNRAGGSSPLVFTLSRPDGQQDIAGLPKVTLPPGLLADVASVPVCSDADVTAGTCPSSSQVGTASIDVGPGSEPYDLSGQPVYLTGPYKGAPYGLAVVVDAVAGPFDLGTVVVRQALYINPTTAQVTIASDSLPTMLGGVPLHNQSISLDIDRPGFMRSPTSCDPMSIDASVTGAPLGVPATVTPGTEIGYASQAGPTVELSTPFRVGACGALRFSPTLGITLTGKGQTRPGDHPRLTATLTQPAGQANLHAVSVALPLSLALDPNNSQHVCSVKAAARIACPKRTIVGEASAVTRILPHPLSGRVYLVQGERRGPHGTVIKTLPTLLIPLRGRDHVKIDLTATTSVNGSEQLVTTFGSIPDAAIRRFVLRITGGRRGILVVTGHRSLCQASAGATTDATGQNGRVDDTVITLRRETCN